MSDTQRPGILPCQAIEALIANHAITADASFEDDQVQPASLDLRLGDGQHGLKVTAPKSFMGSATVIRHFLIDSTPPALKVTVPTKPVRIIVPYPAGGQTTSEVAICYRGFSHLYMVLGERRSTVAPTRRFKTWLRLDRSSRGSMSTASSARSCSLLCSPAAQRRLQRCMDGGIGLAVRQAPFA